jgi:hypothetical protein
MIKKVILDVRKNSISEVITLINWSKKFGAHAYCHGGLRWAECNRPLTNSHIERIAAITRHCHLHGVESWVWLKPGDFRFCTHPSDIRQISKNCQQYLSLGVDGIYIMFDDLHGLRSDGGHIRMSDAIAHGNLISALYDILGSKLVAVCMADYYGNIGTEVGKYIDYWQALDTKIPAGMMLTWTGKSIWNASIESKHFPKTTRPLLLFDNFYASDSSDRHKAPLQPYTGRSPDLSNQQALKAVMLNINPVAAWQFSAIAHFLSFWNSPENYQTEQVTKSILLELGVLAMGRQNGLAVFG